MLIDLTPDQLAVTITALDDYVAVFEEGRGLEERVDAARSILAALRAQRAPAQPAMPEPIDGIALLPCPFCGWTHISWRVERYAYDWTEYAAYCGNCEAESRMAGTKEAAAQAWNLRRRPQPDHAHE